MRASEPAQPAPIAGPFLGCSLPSTSLPDTSRSHLPSLDSFLLCTSSGLCHKAQSEQGQPCSAAQGGWEGAHWAPASTAARCIQEQQWQLQRCAQLPGLENSLGQVKGLERGWPGQHLGASAGGVGLVQTNLSEE